MRNDKRRLYESIMNKIAPIVKKALNEGYNLPYTCEEIYVERTLGDTRLIDCTFLVKGSNGYWYDVYPMHHDSFIRENASDEFLKKLSDSVNEKFAKGKFRICSSYEDLLIVETNENIDKIVDFICGKGKFYKNERQLNQGEGITLRYADYDDSFDDNSVDTSNYVRLRLSDISSKIFSDFDYLSKTTLRELMTKR